MLRIVEIPLLFIPLNEDRLSLCLVLGVSCRCIGALVGLAPGKFSVLVVMDTFRYKTNPAATPLAAMFRNPAILSNP
jgi:hypothetical protein